LINEKRRMGTRDRRLQRGIKLDPHLLWLYSSRGVAYSNNRQYDLAVPDCSEVISAKPKIPAGTIAAASLTKA